MTDEPRCTCANGGHAALCSDPAHVLLWEIFAQPDKASSIDCGACYRCLEPTFPEMFPGDPDSRYQPFMIVCAECGNKRCPHATDHDNACTGSNKSGQPGSRYPGWSTP